MDYIIIMKQKGAAVYFGVFPFVSY